MENLSTTPNGGMERDQVVYNRAGQMDLMPIGAGASSGYTDNYGFEIHHTNPVYTREVSSGDFMGPIHQNPFIYEGAYTSQSGAFGSGNESPPAQVMTQPPRRRRYVSDSVSVGSAQGSGLRARHRSFPCSTSNNMAWESGSHIVVQGQGHEAQGQNRFVNQMQQHGSAENIYPVVGQNFLVSTANNFPGPNTNFQNHHLQMQMQNHAPQTDAEFYGVPRPTPPVYQQPTLAPIYTPFPLPLQQQDDPLLHEAYPSDEQIRDMNSRDFKLASQHLTGEQLKKKIHTRRKMKNCEYSRKARRKAKKLKAEIQEQKRKDNEKISELQIQIWELKVKKTSLNE